MQAVKDDLTLIINQDKKILEDILGNIEKVIVGKQDKIQLIIFALISGGHVLIEDIPGVGKTSLVSALSRSVSCDFKRIQFTPDIMPSDITGFSIFNQKTGEFEFRAGAAMSNFVLADEINRASAKTQASLLEIMEEKQITVDSVTYPLEEPFMVLATQNPSDYLGTYPLPEAQIDRFQIKISLGYPSLEEEVKVVQGESKDKKNLKAVASSTDIIRIQREVNEIYVDEIVVRYMVEIVQATRLHSDLKAGSSPRGSIALKKICQAKALYCGRSYVLPDDVKYVAQYVLSHRISLTHEAKAQKKTPEMIISEILDAISVPVFK